ncbi:MAG TPA: c-type cytochrome, partial [Caldilinea sp.]|nr:c-type cytochrome [Caldilinea sp.]
VAGWIAAALLSIMFAGTTSAQTPPYNPDEIAAPPVRPAAMLGASIYQQNCAPCHGMSGAGDGPQVATLSVAPQSLDDQAALQELAPAAAFHAVKYGSASGAMPALQSTLNDTQLWHAVFYAWSLHTDADRVAAGAALHTEQCAPCHGVDGRGDGADAGDDLQVDFSGQQAMNVRTPAALDAGWQAAHADIGAELTAAEREDVLEAIRAFTYLPPWESPYPRGEGAIEGRIVQGSTDGAAPTAQEVTLMAYMSFTPVATFTTTTDADGAFAFEQLATEPDVVYFVGTNYAEIAYGSDLISLSPLTPTLQLEIPVYETTTDPSALRVNRMQWVVDQQPGALRVRQILIVSNDQDRTVVGRALDGAERPVTLALPAPANAVDLEFQDGALGARYQQVGDVLYDTTPLRPGAQSRQVLMGYTIPFEGTTAAFTTDFAYPVDALTLLVADLPDLDVETDAPLEAVGNQMVQGVAYRVWNGQLDASQSVTLSLQNLIPAAGADPRQAPAAVATPIAAAPDVAVTPSIPPLFAGLGVGALVLVIGGGILYWKYAHDKRQAQQTLLDAKERLLTEIAALDDRHAQGEMDDETWSAERVALMRTVRTVTADIERQTAGRKSAGVRG